MRPSIAEAILSVQPDAEFVITNNDYSTIRWDSPNIKQPTLDEVNAAIDAYVPQPTLAQQVVALQAQVAALLEANPTVTAQVDAQGGTVAPSSPA